MKFKLFLSLIRYAPWIIYFNLKYLPLKQACRLPIFLYKPKLLKCKGSIKIDSSCIKMGMIRLGYYEVSLFPNNGLVWENHGGEVIFNGSCKIGNNSFISIGSKGNLIFGDNFLSTASCKIVSYKRVEFLKDVRVGWDCLIMDTNFHTMTKVKGGYTNATAPILIGASNWIGTGCLVLKGTHTPDLCVFGARSLLNKKYTFESYTLASGNPVEIKAVGLYINVYDDEVEY